MVDTVLAQVEDEQKSEIVRQIERNRLNGWEDLDILEKAFGAEYIVDYSHRKAMERLDQDPDKGLKMLRNPLVYAFICDLVEAAGDRRDRADAVASAPIAPRRLRSPELRDRAEGGRRRDRGRGRSVGALLPRGRARAELRHAARRLLTSRGLQRLCRRRPPGWVAQASPASAAQGRTPPVSRALFSTLATYSGNASFSIGIIWQ